MFLIAVIVLVSLTGGLIRSLSEATLYSVSRSRIETLKRLRHSGGEGLARLRDNVEEPKKRRVNVWLGEADSWKWWARYFLLATETGQEN